MKLKTSLRFFLFPVCAILFLFQSSFVCAAEVIDPTSKYEVHSLPVISEQSSIEMQYGIDTSDKNTLESSHISLSTVSNSEQKSFLSLIIENVNGLLALIQRTVKSGFYSLQNFLQISAFELSHISLNMILISWLISFCAFGLLNQPIYTFSKKLLKSSSNLQIRVVGFASALVVSFTTGIAVQTAYVQQMDFFQSYTGWQLNPVGQDLLLVGGVLTFSFFYFGAGSIVTALKTGLTASVGFIPELEKVVSYFAKETKGAFTETEKECKERLDECSSLFDKLVILGVNYLPGNMPDLGIDDAIINFKNSLFDTPQSQPRVQKAK